MSTPRGKIGRLPLELRSKVNAMIRDNSTAAAIVAYLRSCDVEGVTPQNISSWKRHGYQRWLRRQERLEGMQARREFARQLAEKAAADGDADLTLASNAASALAVDAIQDTLEEFDPTLLKDMLAEKPAKFVDLVDSLTALRRGDQAFVHLRMEFEDYRRRARELAEQTRQRADASGDRDLKALADAMDRALG